MQNFATMIYFSVRKRSRCSGFYRHNAVRVMKITGFIILIACLHVSANGLTQTINLSVKDASLETVIKNIEKQTGYTFFYRTGWFKNAKKVTITAQNLTLQSALELCFKDQPFTYSISGKIITISLKHNSLSIEETKTGSQHLSTINVKGRVTNPNGEPVVGATVSVKDAGKSTTTNNEGEFFLEGIDNNAVLVITSIGYEQMVVGVKNRAQLNLTLPIRVTSLDEFQVIAYGQTTKRLNTGNVSSVKSSEIEKQPINNPLLALGGRIAGVEIYQATGVPGSGINVQIRGKNSYANGNEPLYIIDGVPYPSLTLPGLTFVFGNSNISPGSPFSYINPSNIESIDVLKDADATAIYGSRGANGVVLITTKKGRMGETRLTVNAQTGFGKVARKMDLLNTRQYLDMRYEAFRNDNAQPNITADYDLMLWDTARYTNWQKELIGGTAHYNDIQATISGGNAITQILVGTGYHKETTVFPGDFGDTKASVNFNINNASPNKKFKVSLSGMYTVDDNHLSTFDLTEQAMKLPPNAPAMYNEDGSLNWAPNASGSGTWPDRNPAAMLALGYKTKTNNLVANATVSYQLLQGLEIKSSFGYTNMQTNEVKTVPLAVFDPATWAVAQRNSSFSNNNIRSWIVEPQVVYSTNVLKGHLSVLAGVTIQKNSSTGQILNASGFNSDVVLEDILSATTVRVTSSVYSTYKYSAVFGRVNYNWMQKYLINLTARRDGTSRFGPYNRFHNFGAIGAAWIFTNELSFKIPFLSHGKLRASWGTTGNDQVGDYAYMDLYNAVPVAVPYLNTTGILPYRIYTPNLAWEKTTKAEAGIELGFLRDKVFLSISGYQNRSSNQLINYPLPAVTGFTSINKNLGALVENRGIEVEVKTQNISIKNFQWTTSFNITMNGNKLVSGPAELGTDFQKKIGHPLSSDFVYQFLGVNPINGLYLVADSHGSPTNHPNLSIDNNYLVDLTTNYFGGFQNRFAYKSLQLDVSFQFVLDRQAPVFLSNYIPGYFGYNQPVTVLDRWQKPGNVKSMQRFSQNSSVLNTWVNASSSSQVYGDASYVRLRNASLSWQLPDSWKQNIHLQNGRLFIQGQNLLTITNYKGLDPETVSSTRLPILRVITVGLQATF